MFLLATLFTISVVPAKAGTELVSFTRTRLCRDDERGKMKHDLLHIQGKPYMLVPLHDYRVLTNSDNVSKETGLPEEILNSLAAGQESPVKILRAHRGMTQQELANAAGLSRPYLTEIEKGRKPGSVKALKSIAAALSVDMRDLMAL